MLYFFLVFRLYSHCILHIIKTTSYRVFWRKTTSFCRICLKLRKKRHIHNIPYTFIHHSFINIRWGPSLFLHSCRLSGRNLHGVPSRDSNSGLPYIKPAHYHLSHAAPYLWATLHPNLSLAATKIIGSTLIVILVVAPHSSFLDAFAIFWTGLPFIVNREENRNLLFVGKCIQFAQAIFVSR